MSPLESVDCVFRFFGEGPQFAVVEENTRNICVESSDFYCVADFYAVKNVIQCFESIYCKNVILPVLVTLSDYFIIFCLRFVDHQIAFCEGRWCCLFDVCYPLFGCGCPTYII